MTTTVCYSQIEEKYWSQRRTSDTASEHALRETLRQQTAASTAVDDHISTRGSVIEEDEEEALLNAEKHATGASSSDVHVPA
jgi:hypothetical protein